MPAGPLRGEIQAAEKGEIRGVTQVAKVTGRKERKMIKIAVYGKGGIGKSTTVSNVSAALADMGYKVMQIEAGGPTPGLGCAGRGIIAALEKLKEKGAYDVYTPDVVIYDVLGDVVCGGFSMPMRGGYADKVFIITSGENMAIHAAANIAMAIDGFRDRGYASLGGIILNHRNVRDEDAKVAELAEDIHSEIIGELTHSETVTDAEDLGKTVIEAFPESEMADEYRVLARRLTEICGLNK